MSETEIESVAHAEMRLDPPKEFSSKAWIKSEKEFDQIYSRSIEDPEKFWAEQAESFFWFQKWNRVMNWNEPYLTTYDGALTNISFNCLDRHLADHSQKTAIIFESEKGETRKLSYQELHREVCQFANLLKQRKVSRGDRVAIYMPLIPEAVVAMLACARIGAVHSVVFGGFSSHALSERIEDCGAKVVITADGGSRRGKIINLKAAVDEALEQTQKVETVFVFKNSSAQISMTEGRDIWVHEEVESCSPNCDAEKLESEHPLFILYTSGSTGKPKGILHSTAGYMVYTGLTSKLVFDLKPDDIFWCTADIGWITGHSYVVYGPLANAATIFLYEGAPDYPNYERFWQMIDEHKISIFYTAPTAIRAFMKWGKEHSDKYSLDSLRLLGSVGEPINPEAWVWYYKNIGRERCPIVDTWWQTETGGIMITTLPGAHQMKPGSAGKPLFGVKASIANHDGEALGPNQGGFLIIEKPWPSMIRNIYGDSERYKRTYWEKQAHVYFAGDGAKVDEDGYFWVMGRIDDVVNVSGHRLGTAEIESALVSHPAVCEAAVVGIPDELKGESVVAFVILEGNAVADDSLKKELKKHVEKEIGAIAKPSKIQFADALPKTRSGKIMRRLLRSIASGDHSSQDMSTLEDQKVLDSLRQSEDEG